MFSDCEVGIVQAENRDYVIVLRLYLKPHHVPFPFVIAHLECVAADLDDVAGTDFLQGCHEGGCGHGEMISELTNSWKAETLARPLFSVTMYW